MLHAQSTLNIYRCCLILALSCPFWPTCSSHPSVAQRLHTAYSPLRAPSSNNSSTCPHQRPLKCALCILVTQHLGVVYVSDPIWTSSLEACPRRCVTNLSKLSSMALHHRHNFFVSTPQTRRTFIPVFSFFWRCMRLSLNRRAELQKRKCVRHRERCQTPHTHTKKNTRTEKHACGYVYRYL